MKDRIFKRYTPLHRQRDLYAVGQLSQRHGCSHAVMISKRYETHQIQLVFNLLTLQFESHLGRHWRSPVPRGKIHGSARFLALFVERAPQGRPLLSKCGDEVQAFFGEVGVTMERNCGAILSRDFWLIPNARNLRWRQSLASIFEPRLRRTPRSGSNYLEADASFRVILLIVTAI